MTSIDISVEQAAYLEDHNICPDRANSHTLDNGLIRFEMPWDLWEKLYYRIAHRLRVMAQEQEFVTDLFEAVARNDREHRNDREN